MTTSRSIHVVAKGIISFFFVAERYSVVYIYHIFFTHLSGNGHLDRIHVLAIISSSAVNIRVHVSL